MSQKLYRVVVVLPETENETLIKMARDLELPKSRIFRVALLKLKKEIDSGILKMDEDVETGGGQHEDLELKVEELEERVEKLESKNKKLE